MMVFQSNPFSFDKTASLIITPHIMGNFHSPLNIGSAAPYLLIISQPVPSLPYGYFPGQWSFYGYCLPLFLPITGPANYSLYSFNLSNQSKDNQKVNKKTNIIDAT